MIRYMAFSSIYHFPCFNLVPKQKLMYLFSVDCAYGTCSPQPGQGIKPRVSHHLSNLAAVWQAQLYHTLGAL